nr:ribonuclease 3-like protein 3 isoform X2 [Tanacetum cinerariifolium]
MGSTQLEHLSTDLNRRFYVAEVVFAFGYLHMLEITFISAIYVDSNSSIDATWEVAKILLEPMITPDMFQQNSVRNLNELCHKKKLKIRFRDKWSKQGVYEVLPGDQLIGRGEYKAKKEIAMNRAAEDACNNILNTMDDKNRITETGE